jgi:acyl-CoA synthetase (AMP-forming)/AMP-acid ligase II
MSEINNGPHPVYPKDRTILHMLQHHATETPAATALVLTEGEFVDGNRLEVSYLELWSMVTQIAQALVSADARTGTKWVLICLPEGLQQVCAVWGVLRAGCGYVPIDSETQSARLRILIKETAPSAVIGEAGAVLSEIAAEFAIQFGTFPNRTSNGLVMGSSNRSENESPTTLLMPGVDDFALLFFSSGSTGVPKGIAYDHKWLMGGCYFVAKDMELGPSSKCLLRCSYVW